MEGQLGLRLRPGGLSRFVGHQRIEPTIQIVRASHVQMLTVTEIHA